MMPATNASGGRALASIRSQSHRRFGMSGDDHHRPQGPLPVFAARHDRAAGPMLRVKPVLLFAKSLCATPLQYGIAGALQFRGG